MRRFPEPAAVPLPYTPHYYVELASALSPDEWLRTVGRLKSRMHALGYEFVDFGDADESDRQAIRDAGGSAIFEGQVIQPVDEGWQRHLSAFFADQGLAVKTFETK